MIFCGKGANNIMSNNGDIKTLYYEKKAYF